MNTHLLSPFSLMGLMVEPTEAGALSLTARSFSMMEFNFSSAMLPKTQLAKGAT